MAIAIENNLTNLLGVVLCGGKSMRMGADKGLLLKEDKPWATIVAQKFDALNMPYVVSVNDAQLATYVKYFKSEILILDTQTIPGPLRGLLTVHQQYPQKNLLVLACDMIDMQPQTIQTLINNYTTQPNFNFYAYHNGDFWEPFCGIYTAKGLNSLVLGNQTDFSLQHILSSGLSQKNIILDEGSFNNYNNP
ncbi:MAG: hypothetical protein EAZ15_03355 [Sphingobacteriales bacterium]|nr:MAG: hypothetical protein EAZ15_03355 [Sphingobacteriales bacterium]